MIQEVVNMRTCDPPWGQPGDVRIDRATNWGNPYYIGKDKDGTRDEVIRKYRMYLRAKIVSGSINLSELKNAKRLGCWCKPKACHGDVIATLLQELEKHDLQTTLE